MKKRSNLTIFFEIGWNQQLGYIPCQTWQILPLFTAGSLYSMRFCSQQSAAKRVFLTLSWCFLPMGPPPKTFRAKHGAGGFNGKAGLWKKSTAPVFSGDLSHIIWRGREKLPEKHHSVGWLEMWENTYFLHCFHQIVLNLPSCVVEYSIWKCVCVCVYIVHTVIYICTSYSPVVPVCLVHLLPAVPHIQKKNTTYPSMDTLFFEVMRSSPSSIKSMWPGVVFQRQDGGKSGGVTRTQRWSQMTSNVWGSRGHVLNHLEVYIYFLFK